LILLKEAEQLLMGDNFSNGTVRRKFIFINDHAMFEKYQYEALAKVSVIPERLYRGYGFSGSYNRIPDQKRFGNDSFWSFARGSYVYEYQVLLVAH
jgi:hypothetical protein